MPPAEKEVHAAAAAFANTIFKTYGIKVHSVRFDWLDVCRVGAPDAKVLAVRMETSTE